MQLLLRLTNSFIAVVFVLLSTRTFAAEDSRSCCAKVKNDDKIRKISSELILLARKTYPGSEDRWLKQSTVSDAWAVVFGCVITEQIFHVMALIDPRVLQQ